MTAAGVKCAACGNQLPANSKFCNECGVAVRVAEPAEFKQVTVLFADVVHSMEIAATVGAERLREIMTELVGRSAAVVRRYGGTMEQFTGDGLMAVFGAPIALEDHAIRACLAALSIQTDAGHFADEIHRRDGVALRLRVGLNSGEVTAGATGPGVLGYTLIGEQVGLAQRMESVAPPGGVMLSESTARLVEHAAVLDDTELVHIKGTDKPVPARRLLAVEPKRALVGGTESTLVGRQAALDAVGASVDRASSGRGAVVGLVGPPGVGKSRVLREAAALAADRGLEVYWTFCESHAGDLPFRVVRHLLRAACGIAELGDGAARVRVRTQFPGTEEQDLLLLDDLLGIADTATPLPNIDADARRSRLTTMINGASLARTDPVLYLIEDAHWIDEVSESMLVDFLAVIPQIPAMALITYRPEYHGALRRVTVTQTIALAPLSNSESTALIDELLGTDPSVGDVAATIAERASGNPFFAEEMVRELVQRGVLDGGRGDYVCHADTADVTVPATVQAVIEARIDRLDTKAKRTLNAASVVGSRFGAKLLTALRIDPVFDELLSAELIDQVGFAPHVEYAFRHPLIRAVAYESQLKSDRAEVHRRLAAAIETGSPASTDQNAALIAEHLEAAGELRVAYDWHMRAGAWSVNRDITAARVSWERARQIADSLPSNDPDRTALGIAPLTMLCATGWRTAEANVSGRFEELRTLCEQAGDKASLAMGMTGLATARMFHGRVREASRLVSEQMVLLDSIGDPTLIMGATYAASAAKMVTGAMADVLGWSQAVIDMADDARSNLGMVSPLASALEFRGIARAWLGQPGWQQDLDDAVAMARSCDPVTRALIAGGAYGFACSNGMVHADDGVVEELDSALRAAGRLTGDSALSSVKLFLGVTLVSRDSRTDWDRGLALLEQMRNMWLHERSRLYLVPTADLTAGLARAKLGDRDEAIPVMRRALDHMFRTGALMACTSGTRVLVETLLERCADGDVAEAECAVSRLALAPLGESAVRDIVLLRLRALLARAQGDDATYTNLRDRYREMATSLGFEGHLAMAEAMS